MDAFIARQPIFDEDQEVFAYELLFRSGWDNFFDHDDVDQASSKVIGDSVLVHGLDTLTAGKKGFYNVTRETLVDEHFSMLPKDDTVIEILEYVEPDAEVIAACQKLKEDGYTLALDDFVYSEKFKPILELADIIKVDFLASSVEEQARLASVYSKQGIKMLAEKVETWEVYQQAKDMGYVYFQGYYFSKPTVMTTQEIPGFKLHYLQVLQEIQRPEINFKDLEEVIKRELSLSYKLLRYINSAFFGWQMEISSISHALVLMGQVDVKKWASMMALASMAGDEADELVIQAIVRAKFCESLAPRMGLAARSQDLFLMGMFSMIDGIMNRPLDELMKKLPILEDIKAALMEKKGRLGDIYKYILAYEQGEWDTVAELNDILRIDDEGISALYLSSLEWANQSFKAKA